MTYQAVAFILGCTGILWVIAYSTAMIIKENKEAANERRI